MKTSRYYSHGKLLLTGEYLVLKGAGALAVPLIFGQSLTVSEDSSGKINWVTMADGKQWLKAVFDLDDLTIIDATDTAKAEALRRFIIAAHRMNPELLKNSTGFSVLADVEFDLQWGFGSSSSLISNLAGWFGIDAFDLHFLLSKGSGFDIACARAGGPLFYRLSEKGPLVEPVAFKPAFSKHIFFVYLGQKQDSAQSIKNFGKISGNHETEIAAVSKISADIVKAATLEEFENIIVEHEKILAQVLGVKPLKERRFDDFQGCVKSLGAWGGDFAMFTWKGDRQSLAGYLAAKKLTVFFSFDELVFYS